MQGLFELGAIDSVSGEIVAGDMFDPEVTHDHVGDGFGFEFALLSVFVYGMGCCLMEKLGASSWTSVPAFAVGDRVARMATRPPAE